MVLTSEKARHLHRIWGIRNASSSGTHVGTHRAEGHKLTAGIIKNVIDPQKTLIWGEVPEGASFGFVWAVDFTCIEEGRESVHLFADCACTEVEASVSRATSWCWAGERNALIWIIAEPGVICRNLFGRQDTLSIHSACIWMQICISLSNAVALTSMGKQGSLRVQVFPQSMPSLNEAMEGEVGVKVRSWSVSWAKIVTRKV